MLMLAAVMVALSGIDDVSNRNIATDSSCLVMVDCEASHHSPKTPRPNEKAEL
jgi:hypothetical protein